MEEIFDSISLGEKQTAQRILCPRNVISIVSPKCSVSPKCLLFMSIKYEVQPFNKFRERR